MNTIERKKLPVEIIAHRGASLIAPENTLSSISFAWELNADGVEIDIHLTADGRIVLIHDATTKRTTGIDLTVKESTSTELRNLDAGILKSEEYIGEKIPFLEEVINYIPSGRTLFIEIKCSSEIFPALEKIIASSGNFSQLTIIGFDPVTVSEAKKHFPEIPVYLLCDVNRDGRTGEIVPYDTSLVDSAIGMNIQGLSVHNAGITPDFAEHLIFSGLKLYTWTINDIDEAKRFISLGVHGLVTDRPGWIRKNLVKSHGM
ncbi:glycerophosphodiester phosphodiesterase family protein [Candidatus Latescibacterota bacterium]